MAGRRNHFHVHRAELLAGTSDTDGYYEFIPRVTGKVNISQEHVALVKNALIGVVNEPHGTGSRARMKGITVAGKTGTAQVVAIKENADQDKNEDDIPVHHRDHAWFVAVAPAENPRIALAVLVEHGGHGGSAAAPIAREMIELYLQNS